MEATAKSEIEGRKRMDAQDIRQARVTRYDRPEDDPSFDALEGFRQDRTHRRVIQDWE